MGRLIIALEEKMEQEQLSYRRLSKKIGVSTDTLNMFIKGKKKRLYSDTLIRIAIYANFNLNELKDDYREAGKTRHRSHLAAYTQQELDAEIWEDIKGYDNLYRVSNLGRVMRLDGVNEPRLLGRGGGGNNVVTFIKNDKPVKHYTSDLVVAAFIGLNQDKPLVNFIDGDLSNVKADNLELCDEKGYKVNGERVQSGLTKSKNKPLIAKHIITGEELYFESKRVAVNQGYDKDAIASNIAGGRSHHKNYEWWYLEDYEKM
ncbi:NUMOD4 domain-containing protein [Staphylococcus equorum]|uniref:NUMOD4 domain-containing protein n=1 Tax=Staphylococcus equorum TaxID=246432 RepID=UPI002DBFC21A|nr:NUMOD4 domain-containing protein [Staphylococcus equorum]MEB7746050.1 NUMOD4 domain-containing protein [Staphylococcus equorum]